MSDLDPRVKAIVDAGRQGDVPAPADRARIKRAVLAQIASGAAVATTTAAAAGTLSLGAKVGVAALVLSAAGGGALGLITARESHHRGDAPAHVSPKLMPPPSSAAVALPQKTVSTSRAQPTNSPVERQDRARKWDRSRNVPMVSSSGVDNEQMEDPLNAEVEVLKRAREELRLHRPARALDALTEYDRRFGKGVLGEERQAMAAIASCQAHPGSASRAQAEDFMRRAPRSPLRERVREACITPPATKSH